MRLTRLTSLDGPIYLDLKTVRAAVAVPETLPDNASGHEGWPARTRLVCDDNNVYMVMEHPDLLFQKESVP